MTTYHEVGITDMMFDESSSKDDDACVLSIHSLRVDLAQICHKQCSSSGSKVYLFSSQNSTDY